MPANSIHMEISQNQSSLRRLTYLAVFLLAVISGMRFSDGSILLAISRGATITDPVFSNASVQYLWDSPLKVLLLLATPPNIICIGLVFGILSVLPAVGLLSRFSLPFWLFFTTTLLTPAFKVAIQNIGIGDGLIVMLTVLAVLSSNKNPFLILLFVLISAWHPQQSFFIGLSYAVGMYCYTTSFRIRELKFVALGLAIGLVIYLTYKTGLGFSYSGRGAFMSEKAAGFFLKNLAFSPLAVLPLLIWFAVIPQHIKRGKLLLILWTLLLILISLLTTDVTRVVTVTSLPIVLFGAKSLAESGQGVFNSRTVLAAFLIAFTPAYSWSGVDIFLWPELMADLCKWGAYCIR